jgi:hypothetical protein
MGDATIQYDDGTYVHHKGAHNIMSVLRWIFRNFPNPSHIALTGCSAGGTVLPIAYDLLYKHYNSLFKGGRSVEINVISDSPVYLTPTYFLENAIDHWNPSSIMKRIGFDYEKFVQNETYPTKAWDYVLRRGSNRDRWGFVTHTSDPTSLLYYKYMSGYNDDGGNDDGDGDDGNDDGGDISTQWWSELSNSVSTIEAKHHNVDKFLIDGEGHCSFGLYYAMQENGFEEWAASVFREDVFVRMTPRSVPFFFTSVLLGVGLVAGVLYSQKRRAQPSLELHDGILLNDKMDLLQAQWKQRALLFFARFESFPVTTGYFVATTLYFIFMLAASGFAHPINNPSLGPSAQALSSFGINNPTLIVYQQHQIWRLISSNLLCSGILTYLIVVLNLWKYTRHMEERMGNTVLFASVSFVILLGSNLVYATFASGASCATVSFVLGLNAFCIAMGWKPSKPALEDFPTGDDEGEPYKPPEVSKPLEVSPTNHGSQISSCKPPPTEPVVAADFPNPWVSTILLFLVTCLVFPFNSWVMLVSAMAIGSLIVPMLFDWDLGVVKPGTARPTTTTRAQIRPLPCKLLGLIYLVMLLFLMLGGVVHKPAERYKYPFLTGCEILYTTDVSAIVSSYTGGKDGDDDDDEGQQRHLGEDDNDSVFDNACAQLCVPHIAYRPVLMWWGFQKILPFTVDHGMCQDNGYGEPVADKTFSYMTYSLDVELYSAS